MTGSNSFWFAKSDTGFYNSVATQSLRFEDGDSPVLTRTPSSDGNKRTWTWSCWFKMANIIDTSGNVESTLMSVDNSASGKYTVLGWYQDSLYAQLAGSGQVTAQYDGAKVRDTTGWYHVVWAVDTTQSTSGNRSKVYLNGTQLSFATDNAFPQNTDTDVNDTNYAMEIGDTTDYARHFDGYMAEINFIDGSQLAPTSFGETKEGAWIPKDTSGLTFGTNGYRLQFKQTGTGTASTSTIGADTANSNHFTSSNLASTDSNLPDNPENNFCTLNPLVISAGSPTLSEGNLKLTDSGTDYDRSYGTIGLTSGKWYAEFLYISGDNRGMFGIVREDSTLTDGSGVYIGSKANQYGIDFRARAYTNSTELFDVTNFDTGDIGLIALDIDGGKLWFGRRDVSGTTTIWYDNAGAANGDPSADSNPTYTGTFTGHTWFIGCHGYDGTVIHANFGQDGSFAAAHTSVGVSDANSIGDFNYIESGFLAICTSNLTEPTLGPNSDEQPNDHFETFTFTGNSSATRTISGLNFQPDLLWSKTRNQTFSHRLYDSTRGNDKGLFSNTDAAESTHDVFNGFTSDGYNTTPVELASFVVVLPALAFHSQLT